MTDSISPSIQHGGHQVAGTSAGCRIDRITTLGFSVSHSGCPGTRLTAPNLPTAYALCNHLEALTTRVFPEA